jgi:hypothetical protein
VLQVAEIMLTLVTVNVPPLLAVAPLGAVLSAGAAAPAMRPVSITWWPTCSVRLTEASAITLMSFAPCAPLIDPGARLGSVALASAEAEPGAGGAPAILAFFSTKPPPAPALDGVLGVLLLAALLSRCRQPVAVTWPAMSLDERPVGWLLCGLDVVGWLVVGWLVGGWLLGGGVDGGVDGAGVCAASVPHRATLLHSVSAHCR